MPSLIVNTIDLEICKFKLESSNISSQNNCINRSGNKYLKQKEWKNSDQLPLGHEGCNLLCLII